MQKLSVWFARLRERFQTYVPVRMQLKNNQGAVDGILIGIKKGHYRLSNAYFYEHRPNAQGVEMLGITWIRKEEVLLFQEKDVPSSFPISKARSQRPGPQLTYAPPAS